jgi:diaminopropionate ammonia-lyase
VTSTDGIDLVWNDAVHERLTLARPTDAPLAFHRRLPGYAATPLVDGSAIADQLGLGQVWVKDESLRLELPSFKMLGASWATYRALCERLGSPPDWADIGELRAALSPLGPLRLAAATDGNHGRAVARMARLLGLGADIFVPSDMVAARIEGIKSEGASVTVVDGDFDDAVRRSATEAGDSCLVISDTSWPGYQEVPAWVIEGYSTIFWEIEAQVAAASLRAFDAVLVPMGVGALAAAAVGHFRAADAERAPTMVGVEPLSSECVLASVRAGCLTGVPGPHDSIMAGLNCGLPSEIAWPVLRDGLTAVVGIDDDFAREGMRILASLGIGAGETGAASLGGLLALVRACTDEAERSRLGLTPDSSVLLLMTEGITDPAAYQAIVGASPNLTD